MTTKTDASVFKLPIEGEMTIFRVEELKGIILPVIANNEEIEIDLSNVAEIDAAGLQMMISVKQEAWQSQKSLRFVGHSTIVTAALDICGLSTFFGDPIVISAQSA